MHFSLRLLMTLLGLAVMGWMAYVTWYRQEQDRRTTFFVLAVLVVPMGFLEYRAQANERELGHAASLVAKRDVGVRCQGLLGNLVDIGSELGTVQFDAEGEPANVTHIKRDACKWARDYASGNHRVTLNHAVGVHVIAHEAIHLRGWTNEALTECYGMQHDAVVARALGASQTQAQRLADFYWRMVYPDMPDEYRMSEADCSNGGKYDLHKNSDIWP